MFRNSILFSLTVTLLLSSCYKFHETGRYIIPTITSVDTLKMQAGYDDVFLYNENIILTDRNSGALLEYMQEGVNSFTMDPYMQIYILDGNIYYQSVFDWYMYQTDIYNSFNYKLNNIIESSIFIPQSSGNYLLLDLSMNRIISVTGDIEKEFLFEKPISDYGAVKISNSLIGIYKEERIMLFDYFGNQVSEIETGNIDNFCITEYGILAMQGSQFIYADYRGSTIILDDVHGNKMEYSNNKVLIYDSVTGQALLIRFSH